MPSLNKKAQPLKPAFLSSLLCEFVQGPKTKPTNTKRLFCVAVSVKGSALALGKINCWTGVPGTNEKGSMIVKSHSGL